MKYATIVADPPWDHSDNTGWNAGTRDYRPERSQRLGAPAPYVTSVPYGVLSVTDICRLPVSGLAQRDAHLYLWATNRYLRAAYDVSESWGFSVSTVLVWCKPIRGWTVGGTFMSTAEFVLFCRRGSLAAKKRVERQWFEWPRGEHSAKPEAFLDMVEATSPGPYVELFARRQRFGWDTWGNEALEHVEMSTDEEIERSFDAYR